MGLSGVMLQPSVAKMQAWALTSSLQLVLWMEPQENRYNLFTADQWVQN